MLMTNKALNVAIVIIYCQKTKFLVIDLELNQNLLTCWQRKQIRVYENSVPVWKGCIKPDGLYS